MQSPVIKVDAISLSGDGRAAAIWRPASIFATRLVAMLLADSDPSVIMYWASRAEQLREAASSTLNLPEVQQPGTVPICLEQFFSVLYGYNKMLSPERMHNYVSLAHKLLHGARQDDSRRVAKLSHVIFAAADSMVFSCLRMMD